ncbi:DUF397 domain-containing protein [Kibdelosporangium banguiense]|uniref:DUF397 domain-containing protein n=1 Tax=Kibdelosporangium banguiense TaxID=1365924 RepID=UPI003556D286
MILRGSCGFEWGAVVGPSSRKRSFLAEPLTWKKLSFTGGEGDCVRRPLTPVSCTSGDSKAPRGGTLVFPDTAWHRLLASMTE